MVRGDQSNDQQLDLDSPIFGFESTLGLGSVDGAGSNKVHELIELRDVILERRPSEQDSPFCFDLLQLFGYLGRRVLEHGVCFIEDQDIDFDQSNDLAPSPKERFTHEYNSSLLLPLLNLLLVVVLVGFTQVEELKWRRQISRPFHNLVSPIHQRVRGNQHQHASHRPWFSRHGDRGMSHSGVKERNRCQTFP